VDAAIGYTLLRRVNVSPFDCVVDVCGVVDVSGVVDVCCVVDVCGVVELVVASRP
jgi:hypothetical protein